MQYLLKKTTKLSQKKPISHKKMLKATKNRINILSHATNRRQRSSLTHYRNNPRLETQLLDLNLHYLTTAS